MNEISELWGIDAKEKTSTLREINRNEEKWETTYKDDSSGELWVLDYPFSNLQGGGTPRLKLKKNT